VVPYNRKTHMLSEPLFIVLHLLSIFSVYEKVEEL